MSRSYCFFSAQYLPHLGGVERYTYELAKRLIAHGNEVTVVTSSLKGCPAYERTAEGIEVWRLPSLPLLNGRLPIVCPTPTRRRLMKELQRRHFDLVVINTRFYPLSLYGAKVANRLGCPCLTIEHGADYLTLASPVLDALIRAYERGVTALLKRRCTAFYGVSKISCEWLSTFGIEAKGVLYNAADFDRIEQLRAAATPHIRAEYGIAPTTPTVVYAGRLVEEKGVRALIEAVMQIAEVQPIHLLLAGDGPLLAQAQQAAPCVTALGKLPFEQLIAVLGESDIFCLPSRSEGFCMAYLEAVACRCFAVCTPVGGVPEVVTDRDYGELIADNSTASIKKGLEAALAREDRTACAQRAYERAVSMFTFENTARALEAAVQVMGEMR